MAGKATTDIDARRTNLPAERTSLVGRTTELQQLQGLLRGPERLVTLVGPPGVGKTRLALQAGRWLLQDAPEASVFVVPLAGVESAAGVAAAVARALGLSLAERPEQSAVEQLATVLPRHPPSLLILDNFEQLTPLAEETLGRWLEASADLRFLVTSRQALSIPGEQRMELSPLGADEAVELFVARARAVTPAFEADPQRRALLQQLVERLDRLPLTIELAAPRAAMLGPEAIHERLENRFALLTTEGRQLDQRHATLRQTIDWSWHLLDPDEQRALCACALFAGNIELSALDAVLRAGDATVRLVQALRERSLLSEATDHSERGGPVRFQLLESIRDYAREQLEQRPDADELRQRFVAHFLGQGEAWAGRVGRSSDAAALAALQRALDNVLRAWDLARADDAQAAVRLALAAGTARRLLGPHEAHRHLLQQATALAEERFPQSALYGRVLVQRADAHIVTGRRPAAVEDLRRAVTIAEALADAELEAQAQLSLGAALRDAGELNRGRPHLERAAELFTELGQTVDLGHAVGALATLYRQQGRADLARSCYERAIQLHREADRPDATATELAGLGHLEAAAGERTAAVGWYRRALSVLDEVGDRRTRGVVLDRMAGLALQDGEPDVAAPLLQEAADDLAAVGDGVHLAVVQAHTAVALASQDRRAEALQQLEDAGAALERQTDPRLWSALSALKLCVELVLASDACRRQPRGDACSQLREAARRARALVEGGATDGQRYTEYVTEAHQLLARLLQAAGPIPDADDGPRQRVETHAPPAAEPAPTDGPTLIVERTAQWFVLPSGERVSLQRMPLLARLLDLQVQQRLRQPGVPLPSAEVIAGVWSDDGASSTKAATNRLYVAIAKLRRLGLEGILMRQAGGYLLLPSVECLLQDAPPD